MNHPAYHKLINLQVGEHLTWPRVDMKFVIYVSHLGRRRGRKFRTQRTELGRRVERLA